MRFGRYEHDYPAHRVHTQATLHTGCTHGMFVVLAQVPEAWRKHVLESTARLAEKEKRKSAQNMMTPTRKVFMG